MATDTPAPRPPLPPFTEETRRQKVQAAEDAWNTATPIAWCSHTRSIHTGATAASSSWDATRSVPFSSANGERELDYALRKDLWAFTGDRIAVRFQYEWHDAGGQWWRSYGNENWEFDEHGLMRRREASINDVAITESERRIDGARPAGDAPNDPAALSSRALPPG